MPRKSARPYVFLSRASKPIYIRPKALNLLQARCVLRSSGPKSHVDRGLYDSVDILRKNMLILFLKIMMFWTVLVNLAGLGVCLSAQTIFIINSIWILFPSIWNSLQLNWVLFNLIQSNLHRKLSIWILFRSISNSPDFNLKQAISNSDSVSHNTK